MITLAKLGARGAEILDIKKGAIDGPFVYKLEQKT